VKQEIFSFICLTACLLTPSPVFTPSRFDTAAGRRREGNTIREWERAARGKQRREHTVCRGGDRRAGDCGHCNHATVNAAATVTCLTYPSIDLSVSRHRRFFFQISVPRWEHRDRVVTDAQSRIVHFTAAQLDHKTLKHTVRPQSRVSVALVLTKPHTQFRLRFRFLAHGSVPSCAARGHSTATTTPQTKGSVEQEWACGGGNRTRRTLRGPSSNTSPSNISVCDGPDPDRCTNIWQEYCKSRTTTRTSTCGI
jgi:hypothetical protein